MNRYVKSLVKVPRLRRLYFRLRFWYFTRLRKRLRHVDSEDAFRMTVEHNLKGVAVPFERMNLLIKPVSVLGTVNSESKVLVIGPRNEYDLLLLAAQGLEPANCRGLDLISYSPWIDIGDMHALPYADNAFDVVLCGWTISYSARPAKAADEICRVVRPGGIVGIAVQYYSKEALVEDERAAGYAIQEKDRLPERVNSVADILKLFGEAVGDVYFNHDAPCRCVKAPSHGAADSSEVGVIFSVKKEPQTAEGSPAPHAR